jgi:formate hydrogenlyase subunit 3/multisubunit Na+/H+ antiporter MnhD subunit
LVYALLLLIITTLACWAMALASNVVARARAAWAISLVGVAASLVLSLVLEGAGSVQGKAVVGAEITDWLHTPIFTSDALSACVGAWCLALGLMALLKIGVRARENTPRVLALATGTLSTLYSLAATVDLRAFAVQVLLLALLVWALYGWDDASETGDNVLSRVSLGGGALLLLAAVLLMGRTTGGEYHLNALSLSALSIWPLTLIVGFALLWLGLSPFTGWSAITNAHSRTTTASTLAQSLVLGVPPLLLIVRLQALVTQGALTGSTPGEWAGAMSALVILGGLTAVAGGASTLLWAGTARWPAALTAFYMGLMAWALGLDAPAGRWAALILLAGYGVGRMALQLAGRDDHELNSMARAVAGLALAGAPLTTGFLGLWLLSGALVETRSPQYAIVLLSGAVMAACGTALHVASTVTRHPAPGKQGKRALLVTSATALLLAAASVAGGVLPGLWIPQVETIANIAGRGQAVDLPWTGLTLAGELLPITLPAAGVLVLVLVGLLLRVWARSRVVESGVLLPTALARLQRGAVPEVRPAPEHGVAAGERPANPFITQPPASVWWVSLIWLERGIYGAGAYVAAAAMRIGGLLARLEGRYFLPLALLLTLLILLAITR